MPIESIQPRVGNPRTHSAKQVQQIASSIRVFGFLNPIIVDENNVLLAGHGRWLAAKQTGLKSVPIVQYDHLSEVEKRAFVIADNRIAEQAGWDRNLLRLELGVLADLLPPQDLDLSITGFAIPEFDALQRDLGPTTTEPDDKIPEPPASPVSAMGDIWLLGKHRILCGDSRQENDFRKLFGTKRANAIFTDPPFNLKSRKIGSRGRFQHRDFAFASGEMSKGAYRIFLAETLGHGVSVSAPGAVHFVCIDWRHVADLIEVAGSLFDQMLNLIVWNKTNAGQGSFYRSQHELIGVFRAKGQQHRNNIELGRFGRNRSNVWTYPGVNTFGKDRLRTLSQHPTVKPVALVADALLDCTAPGDIVLDQFSGSGTTILAAEKVGRIAHCLEYDPAYVDVSIQRWQAATKQEAIREQDGLTFESALMLRQSGVLAARPAPLSNVVIKPARSPRKRRHD